MSCYIFDVLGEHLTRDHEDVETVECFYCNIQLNKAQLAKHYYTHGIGLYQCVYCTYSTNNKIDVDEHISDFHPYGQNFASARVLRKEPTVSAYLVIEMNEFELIIV